MFQKLPLIKKKLKGIDHAAIGDEYSTDDDHLDDVRDEQHEESEYV